MAPPLLQFTSKGIYCDRADVYLDPWKPVNRAIISHGHSDHARWGHRFYLTHQDNDPIIKKRLGNIYSETLNWGDQIRINGVTFSLHPAGHVLGSAQIRVEYKGEIWVFTGDYKLQEDGFTETTEIVPCHSLITECTFGLPVFKWQPQKEVIAEIAEWYQQNAKANMNSILFCYSLGKAQRVIHALSEHIDSIYTHSAIENMNEVIREIRPFPETYRITPENASKIKRAMIIAPPSAHGSSWIRRFTPFVTGSASGWMAIRGHRKRRAIDRGFVLSDHVDWNDLIQYIDQTGASKVICTHGYSEQVVRFLKESKGLEAAVENTDFSQESE